MNGLRMVVVSALIALGCSPHRALAGGEAQVVELQKAADACGWGPLSPQFSVLRTADQYVRQDYRTSAAELLALHSSTIPEQALAAVASCVADVTGEPDELTPRGGPPGLVRINRWGERLAFDPARGAPLWAAHVLTAR